MGENSSCWNHDGLPPAPQPVANYAPFLLSGNQLFISGQISKAADGHVLTGTLGADLDVAAGQNAARLCALNILAQTKAALAMETPPW